MPCLATVSIHSSQFPENVQRDLLESLRTRQVNHKFHYDSVKQTQKWLALHEALSPARTDANCAATYDRSFEATAARVSDARVHLIGLGCGGGQKDGRLLELLRTDGKEMFYTPSDVSTAMTLVAWQRAMKMLPPENCFPLVCDLVSAIDLPAALEQNSVPGAARLITFFGMMPNFEPEHILPRLADLVRTGDHLLLSANLAPGPEYAVGAERILPLYDNELTRDWLLSFLLDLGVEASDGDIRFSVEQVVSRINLRRVAAHFRFVRAREIKVGEHGFKFENGEAIRLFFSYRHTPAIMSALLKPYGLRVLDQWITESEEEGVFLVERE